MPFGLEALERAAAAVRSEERRRGGRRSASAPPPSTGDDDDDDDYPLSDDDEYAYQDDEECPMEEDDGDGGGCGAERTRLVSKAAQVRQITRNLRTIGAGSDRGRCSAPQVPQRRPAPS